MNRTLDVTRIQLVNWRSTLGQPLLILTIIFALNLAVFLTLFTVIGSRGGTFYSSGAGVAIFFIIGISHLQTMTQFFPFLLGMSVTRRDFYLGSVLFVVGQAVAFGLLMALGQAVELATRGWGISMWFFNLGPRPDVFTFAWPGYLAVLLLFSAVGLFLGAVFKRWGQVGVWVVTLGLTVLVAAVVVAVTLAFLWGAVAAAVTATPAIVLAGVLPTLAAAVLGAATWLVVRRATP